MQRQLTSRRRFLRQMVFGDRAAVAAPRGRTLVCIFLRGGCDTLNLIVPYGDDAYYRVRPTLAIAAPPKGEERADAAIRLDDFYAFHPKMKPLVPLFREGRFGAVQAVGTDNESGSHFEAQDQIEHGERAGRNLGGGWLGRHLRGRTQGNDAPLAGIAIGATIPESLRGAPAATAFHSIDDIQLPASSGDPGAVARSLSRLYAAEVGVLGQQGAETLDLLKRVEQVRGKPYIPEPGAIPEERLCRRAAGGGPDRQGGPRAPGGLY